MLRFTRLLGSTRRLTGAAAVTGLLTVVGCGSGGSATTPVTGRVVVDGRPAANAIVTLHPADGRPAAEKPVGTAGPDGEFDLTTGTTGDGAPPGEYRVTVSWLQPVANRRKGGDGDDAPPRSLLPATYANPATTPLRATVRPGDSEPLAIVIKRR